VGSLAEVNKQATPMLQLLPQQNVLRRYPDECRLPLLRMASLISGWLGFCVQRSTDRSASQSTRLSPTDANAGAKAIIPHARLRLGTSRQA